MMLSKRTVYWRQEIHGMSYVATIQHPELPLLGCWVIWIMKINTKSVEPIDVCTLHITVRDNKRDSFEKSKKCGTEMTLNSISLQGMGQTSRSGPVSSLEPADMIQQDIRRYKTRNFISIVTDENIHMDVRFGKGRTKRRGGFRLRDKLLSYICSHLCIKYYDRAMSPTNNGITISLLLDTWQCRTVSC